MNYWLVKSEPDDCGIQHFVDKGSTAICWDGVRNYQARNFLRKMDTDDLVFLYHSSCKVIGIAGTLKVTRAAYPDPLQFEVTSRYFDAKSTMDQPRWTAVDLVLDRAFRTVIGRAQLQSLASFAGSPLTGKGSRLSVMPITKTQWSDVVQIASVIEDY